MLEVGLPLLLLLLIGVLHSLGIYDLVKWTMLLLALSRDHREDLPDLRECGRLLVTDKTPVLGVSLNN